MNIFTYGSLMFPEVWQRVTGLSAAGEPAKLADFEARALSGQTYPALVGAPGAVTDGVVYSNVEAAALSRLDLFEADFYVRREVRVNTGNGEIPAQVYVAAMEDHPDILREPWQAKDFQVRHLAGFLKSDPGFSGAR